MKAAQDSPAGPAGAAVAVVVARQGRLPAGAPAAVVEAGGSVVVVGSGAEEGARACAGARRARWAETGPGFGPARLAAALAGVVRPVPLVVLPSSPDGRDLAPRLAATLERPLLAGALCARVGGEPGRPTVRALVSRLDDRVLVPVEVTGPAVVTLLPGAASTSTSSSSSSTGPADVGARDPASPGPEPLGLEPLAWPTGAEAEPAAGERPAAADPEFAALLEPDVRTMDLSEATRVMAGGAGLAHGADDGEAAARFALLEQVAAAIGASAGATRVATDAGWTGYERQIGTTGVTISPELYVTLGVSGATQHIGGIGSPRHVVSVNTDPSCPMTAAASLGLVTDANGLLVELARRFGVGAPRRSGTGAGHG